VKKEKEQFSESKYPYGQNNMKKILIIEDNQDVRENLAERLVLANYMVQTAENGKIGVDIALDDPPDLILCDIMMPVMDGFNVLHILSNKPSTAGIPFIFLTAKAEMTDLRQGMNLGADDYITKPYDDLELLNAVETRLRKTEHNRKKFDGREETLQNFINEAKAQKEFDKLSDKHEIYKYRKKDHIYQEGQFPKYLYFIVSGKVKIFKTNDFGKEYIIEVYKNGEFFGYHSLLNNTKNNDSASALEDSELRLIPKDDFDALMMKNRDFSFRFIKMIANNLEDREEQLLNLAYNSIRKRVAQSLVHLYEKYENEGNAEISILRDDLASMVGTAKESVIRTLTDFKSEGLIKIENGTISVLEKEKLSNLPN
jgi:CRP-like cAMP-binding protein